MRSFISSAPLSLVGIAIAVVVSVAASPATARALGTRRSVAALLLFGFGLVLAATLVPDAEAMAGATAQREFACDTSRVSVMSLRELLRITDASLNVLLFVPLGLAVGLLPRTRRAAAVAAAAFSLTFVVEATQLVVIGLGRGCQTADLADNLLGLAIGFVIATLARAAMNWMPDRQR